MPGMWRTLAALVGASWMAATPASSSATPDPERAFDVEFGAWTVQISRLIEPLSGSNRWLEYSGTSIVYPWWGGRANVGELRVEGPAGRIDGMSVRLYEPATRQWEPNWAARFTRDRGDADAAAIRAVWADLDAAWNTRDAARFSTFFVDDASFEFVDPSQVIDGRDAIRRHFQDQFPRTAAEFSHQTRIRSTRRVADGVVATDGVVQIMRTPAARGSTPAVFRTFAIHAVMVRTGDVWRIGTLRIFPMPGPSATDADVH